MKEIVFKPAVIATRPDQSFVLKFPGFTLSLLFSNGKLNAEVLEGTKRSTFESEVKDNSEEFEKIVNKLMKNLNTVMRIDHKK